MRSASCWHAARWLVVLLPLTAACSSSSDTAAQGSAGGSAGAGGSAASAGAGQGGSAAGAGQAGGAAGAAQGGAGQAGSAGEGMGAGAGGGAGQGAGGAAGASGPVSAEERDQALAALSAKLVELMDANDPQIAQKMADFAATLPVFDATGLSSSGAWARYRDGHAHFIVTDRGPIAAKAAATPAPAPAPPKANLPELPAGANARFVSGFAQGDAPFIDEHITALADDAGLRGYVKVWSPTGGTVGELRNVADDGVFYFVTHGGAADEFPGSGYPFCLMTQDAPASLSGSLAADWDEGLLATMTSETRLDAQGHAVSEARVCIKREFVTKYFSFRSNALVWFDVCHTQDPGSGSQATRERFLDKGVAAVVGWSNTVAPDVAFNASTFAFDALLGTHQLVQANALKERPWELSAVHARAIELGLDTSIEKQDDGTTTTGKLLFTPRSGVTPGPLAPSIRAIKVAEKDDHGELTIYGAFGTDPGEKYRVVTVGDQGATVKSWAPDQIVVSVPVSGAGAAGDVQVSSLGRPSNVVRLTEYRGDFNYTLHRDGSETLALTSHFHFRVDLHDYRLKPGGDPYYPSYIAPQPGEQLSWLIAGAHDSSGQVAFSGSSTDMSPDCPTTESWSGGGDLFGSGADAGGDLGKVISFAGKVMPDRSGIVFGVFAQPKGQLLISTKSCNGMSGPSPAVDSQYLFTDDFGGDITLALGSDFTISSGQQTKTSPKHPGWSATTSWSNVVMTPGTEPYEGEDK